MARLKPFNGDSSGASLVDRRRELSGPGYFLEVMRSVGDLDRIREEWVRLASEKAPFHSFSWNRSWAAHFECETERLSVFVLRRNRVVVAILPCYRTGPVFRLLGDLHCDYQDILAASDEDAERLLNAAFVVVAREGGRFDFRKLSGEGLLLGAARRIGRARNFLSFEKSYGRCPYFLLAGTAEETLAGIKSSVRKRIRRALRRLEDVAPGHSYRMISDGEITGEAIDRIAGLHGANQHRKSGKSIFRDRRYREFLLEVAAGGDAGLRLLEIYDADGNVAAFDLGFEKSGRFQAYLGAYDEPYAAGSPGMCLLHWQLHALPDRGTRIYDFLCGEESYKFDYATDSYPVVSMRLYSPGIRNRLRFEVFKLAHAAKRFLKPFVQRLGLL